MKKRFICATLAVVMLLSVFAVGPFQARAESNMTISAQGEAMIKEFEGINWQPKWDVKQASVGYGCSVTEDRWNITDPNDPLYVPKQKDENGNFIMEYNDYKDGLDYVISLEGAQLLLNEHMAKHAAAVNDFANRHGITFTQGEFDALVSLSFNIGSSFLSEKKKDWHIHKALASGDKGAYLAYAFALYSTSGGVTSQGHIKRRLLELDMFLYNRYDLSKSFPKDLRYILFDGNGGLTEYIPHGFNVNHPVSDFWVTFTQMPTGTDANGNPFTYEFAGWFNKPVGGEQITVLDRSLESGMVLYAHWRNPTTGQIDDLRPGAAADVKVKATSNVTMREGPCSYYTKVRTVYSGELLHITWVTTGKDGKQWGLTPEGWVRLDYTNYGTTGGSEESREPGTWATITASSLKVRTGPGTSYADTGSRVKNGAVVKIQATQMEGTVRKWGQMTDGNWICLEENGNSYADIEVITEQTPVNPGTPDISGAITITKVEIEEMPTRLEYPLGGSERVPDMTGAEVTITFSNGKRKWSVDITRGMVTGFDNSKPGINTLTVTVGGKSATLDVTIVPVNIVSISMGQLPAKRQYLKGQEQLDLTGVTLNVQYSPAATETVPVTPDMVTGFDNSITGTQTITVTYKDFTTSFTVDVVSNDPEGISIQTMPNKLTYLKGAEQLDLTGATISVRYNYTGVETVNITPDMVTGFDNSRVGTQRLTVTYQGFTTGFDVQVVLPTVVFQNYDGTVISSAQYEIGAAVTVPANPTKPADEHGEYVFVGWDKEVTACTGNTTYTAVFKLAYPMGDVNRNMKVDGDDAIYLLRHVLFPEKYPVEVAGDYDKDGDVDGDDAIYLLRHVLFPEKYPLT